MRAGGASALRVGLLLLVTAALLVAMLLLLPGSQTGAGVKFETDFAETVQGLDIGAPVKFRGVTLGAVTRIALAASLYGDQVGGDQVGERGENAAWRLVVVRFAVDPVKAGRLDLAAAVRDGLRSRLASQGLTGLAYLELDYADRQPPPLLPPLPWTPANPRIPSVPSTLAVVKQGAETLLGKLNAVDLVGLAGDSAAVLHALRREFDNGDVRALLAQSRASLATLQDVLARSDLPALARQARDTLAALQRVADDPALRALPARADIALARLTVVADRLPPLIAALQATAGRADGAAADLQAQLGPILSDVQATMQNFRDISERLRQDPGAVLSAPPPPERRR